MIAKLVSFYNLPLPAKMLALEAVFFLPYCQCCVKMLPLRHLVKMFRLRPVSKTLPVEIHQENDYEEQIQLVKRLVTRISNLPLPLRPRCLAQALVARRFLHRKHLPTQLFLGVSLEGERMTAHAWLQCGTTLVTGEHHVDKYRQIVAYC